MDENTIAVLFPWYLLRPEKFLSTNKTTLFTWTDTPFQSDQANNSRTHFARNIQTNTANYVKALAAKSFSLYQGKEQVFMDTKD